MAVTVGDVFAFALEQTLFGQQVINTFAIKVTAVPGATAEETWVDNWFLDATGYMNLAAGLRDKIVDAQASQVAHKQWLIRRVTPNPTQVFIRPIATNAVGGDAGDAETANIAGSITRKGLAAGRRQKGRVAIAGLPTTAYAAGKLNAPAISLNNSIGAAMRGLQTRAAGDAGVMGFWNPGGTRLVNGLPVIYLPQFTEVVTTTAQETVRVQRSRTVGVGS